MFFTAMLRGTENTAVIRCSGMNVQDQEKVAAVRTLRQAVQKQQPQEMLTWVNACRPLPTYERICTRAAIADSLRNGPIAYMWKKLGGEADPYSCMPLEEVMATKRTRRTAEWTRRNSSRLHALRVKASQDGAPRGNMARQLLELLPKREHEMKDNVAAD